MDSSEIDNVLNREKQLFSQIPQWHQDQLLKSLSHLPTKRIRFAFAYGSGLIFKDGDKKTVNPNMIDLIIVTDDTYAWHLENLAANKKDYSGLRFAGIGSISRLQNLFPYLYCNTKVYVPEIKREIKYSVISTKNLLVDLYDWQTLYVSGRLHKPVAVLRWTFDDVEMEREYKLAFALNLKRALHAALLLLPERFTIDQMYSKIASISYFGDVRVGIAENPNKIKNIVKECRPYFDLIYEPLFKRYFEDFVYRSDEQLIQQNLDPAVIHHHLSCLPKWPQWNIRKKIDRFHQTDLESLIFRLAHSRDVPRLLEQALSDNVARSSRNQTLKNVLSAGFRKSVLYGFRKFTKFIHKR